MNEKEMSLVDHLAELRGRLIWIIGTFVLSMAAGFVMAEPVVNHLKNDPVAAHISWHVFGISDALRIYMQVAFVLAIIFTLPVILYHVWKFVAPGLMDDERRAIRTYIPFAFLLLLVGIAFGYYVLFPMIIQFMSGFSTMLGAEETYGMTQYFQFMFNLIVPISLLFELPVVIMFLTTIRIVRPDMLVKFRKYAIFLSVVIASMITPPDLLSHISAAIPLIILYEISVWLAKMIYRKQVAKDQMWEKEEEEFATIETDDK